MTAMTTDDPRPSVTADGGAADAAGLRERKKRRTRDALIEAAYTLVIEQGYESTTVDQIADAVEVSPRTFFRYFGSKEDVVLDIQDRVWDAVYEAWHRQPAHLPVVAAVRKAMAQVLARLEDGGFGIDIDRMEQLREVIATDDRLCALSAQRQVIQSGRVVALIAERMGVDPAADIRPELVAALIVTATHVGVHSPRAATGGAGVAARIDTCLSLLQNGVDYPAAS
ncbi:TetR family transcriptional regulator [Actinorhabdospora filicis]|uniref:TetR family transcriptional regulator n=1 Tax=Actinorhabdospora filicis TaxID=1785913 RepID=A0A9W6SMU9_9ACTN|nr:TetR family transcriptional regulator [Actinorhabdospora filicis]GLZ78883.1 TetR family transcriptional regulator [Actinorhabdospora filicis]